MANRSERKGEFQRHKKEIEEAYQRKLDALYELYPEFKCNSASSSDYGSLSKIFSQSVETREGEFTSRDIKLWIAENNPVLAKSMTGASLSNGLKRLEKHGKIETVRRGKGSMPTVYRRKKAGEKMV